MTKITRDQRLTARFTQTEKLLLQLAANSLAVDLSAFIRSAAIRAARAELQDAPEKKT